MGGAGGGSGGGVFVLSPQLDIGTNKINTTGGGGGASTLEGGAGGAGGKGRVTLYSCDNITGSLSSSYYGSYYTNIDASQDWCQVYGGMI